MWFEVCSGLRVNLEKSELIPVGRVNDIEDLTLELGCKVGGLPSSYLGLPLGAPFKSEVVWDCVEERFRKKVGYVEETIYFQRGKTHPNSEHSI